MQEAATSANKKYFILILLLIFLGSFFFVQVVMDDALIPARYGYNLIHYGIWNFSPNPHNIVEAYTTFLYALISIIPAFFHIHPYIIYKITGAACFLGVILLLYFSTDKKHAALFAILVFTANWQTYVHTFSGIETMLWFLLYLAIIFLLNSDLTDKRQVLLWILCLLLPLTRPEGITVSAFAFFYLHFIRRVRIHYISLLICAAIGLLYFLWRYHYFGLLFPLPFYQKSVKHDISLINFLINTFRSAHYIAAIALLFFVFKKNYYVRILCLFSLVLFFLVYSTSVLSMNFADRFPYQLFFPPLLFGIVSSGTSEAIEKIKIRYSMIFLVIFIFAKGIYGTHAKDLSSMGDNLFSSYYYSRTHLNLAMHFRNLHHPDMKVFCNEAGIFPYYSNIDYYDPEGLTNKDLCTKSITREYIEKINPDAFLYLVTIPKEEVNTWVNSLGKSYPLVYYKYLLTDEQYDKIGYVTCIEYNVYIGIAVNKNSKYYQEICAAGKDAIAAADSNTFNIRKFFKFKYIRSFPAI